MLGRSFLARVQAHIDESAAARAEGALARAQALAERARAHTETVQARADNTLAHADLARAIGDGRLDQEQAFNDAGNRLKRIYRDIKRLRHEVARLDVQERKLTDAAIDLGRLDYARRDIFMRLDSVHAIRRTRSCQKEPWTVDWLEQRVGPSDVLYDIGANVGAYALLAATAREGRVVVAIEPNAMTFSTLCANALLNDVGDALVPLQVALGAQTGLGAFGLRDLDPGSAFHVLAEPAASERRVAPMWAQPVLTFALDDLLARFALPFPTHLKIDVDGGELAVLRGAEQTIADPRLRTALIEIEDESGDEVATAMHRHGFALESRHRRTDKRVTQWYGLFVR